LHWLRVTAVCSTQFCTALDRLCVVLALVCGVVVWMGGGDSRESQEGAGG